MSEPLTVDLDAARQLLDFGKRLNDPHRAEEQLQGAVALHNVLQQERVAYLADEVGMGKTYVALGAVALFRHFIPVSDDDRTYDLTVEDDTLLALDEQTDARRVALCLQRVVDAADAVELALLGKDAPLSSFSADLHNEVTPDDV